jgi:hypothetical protein
MVVYHWIETGEEIYTEYESGSWNISETVWGSCNVYISESKGKAKPRKAIGWKIMKSRKYQLQNWPLYCNEGSGLWIVTAVYFDENQTFRRNISSTSQLLTYFWFSCFSYYLTLKIMSICVAETSDSPLNYMALQPRIPLWESLIERNITVSPVAQLEIAHVYFVRTPWMRQSGNK